MAVERAINQPIKSITDLQATPSSPVSNKFLIYVKSENELYKITSRWSTGTFQSFTDKESLSVDLSGHSVTEFNDVTSVGRGEIITTAEATDIATNTTHRGRTDNPHGVTSTQVGLGNVDNTSDVDKPVSTLAQAALDSKEDVLGNPTTDGYVLSSTISGVRIWVPPTGTVTVKNSRVVNPPITAVPTGFFRVMHHTEYPFVGNADIPGRDIDAILVGLRNNSFGSSTVTIHVSNSANPGIIYFQGTFTVTSNETQVFRLARNTPVPFPAFDSLITVNATYAGVVASNVDDIFFYETLT